MVVSLMVAVVAAAQPLPKPVGYVNDFAHVLNATEAKELELELSDFEKRTTIEICVVTVPSLEGQEVSVYASTLANQWGIGKSGANNGVIFLIAPVERKLRIAPGSGLSRKLSNSQCDEIIRVNVIPRFKAGQMPVGIIAGTRAIMATVDPRPATTRTAQADGGSNSTSWTAHDTFILKVIGAVLGSLIVIGIILYRPYRKWSSARYIRSEGESMQRRFTEYESTMSTSDVSDDLRNRFTALQDRYRALQHMVEFDSELDWTAAKDSCDQISSSLQNLLYKVGDEIRQAKRARIEGPKLMSSLPELLETAEKKLAEGKTSEKAANRLARAREQYASAQAHLTTQSDGMGLMNWVMLYALLSDSHNECTAAVSAHDQANGADWSSESSSHSSSSSHDSGSSSFDSFGGGGGFSSDSGSSGSW